MSEEPAISAGQVDPEDTAKFEIESYKECFREKRHYDVLSWTLFAGLGLLLRPLVESMVSIDGTDPIDIAARWGLTAGICGALFIYWRIYERNRFWAEVCNETAREFERKLRVSGASLAYMKGAIERKFVLTNIDLNGVELREPKTERAPRSAHFGIRAILIVSAVAVILLAVRNSF